MEIGTIMPYGETTLLPIKKYLITKSVIGLPCKLGDHALIAGAVLRSPTVICMYIT